MSAASLGEMPWRPAWRSPVVPWDSCTPERQADLREAWSEGDLRHQLTPSQRDTYSKLRKWEARPYTARGRQFVLDCSRRWGKSLLGLIWLIENCLRRPGSRYLYIGPERKQIEDLIVPLMALILIECPPEMRPAYKGSKRVYEFPNGSRIELYGLDKNPNASRGGAIDGAFLDECGFFKRLWYLLKSVLKPQLMGRIWASLLLASTPPDTPAHPWTEKVVPDAIGRNAYDRKTIEDADQYPVEEIESMIGEAGGRADPACQREYFAMHVADAERIVVPEYALVAHRIVREEPRPRWFDAYTVMDPGWHDLLAVLFCHWNFAEAKLVVEDELAEVKMSSGKLVGLLKAKEVELWGDVKCANDSRDGLRSQPYRRFTDRDPRLVGDLRADHGLSFSVAKKDTPEQAVNQLRNAIGDERIIIHPRCVKLQAHLRAAIWKNELHKAFSWQGGPFGHFDLVATLIYAWRNVDRTRNPAPKPQYAITPESFDRRALVRPTDVSKFRPNIRARFGR